MKTLHTPGPWESMGFYISSRNVNLPLPNSQTIARVYSDHEKVGGNTLANANLIAAAPDLLNALKALMKCAVRDAEHYAPDGNEPIWAFISDASDAICKAERGAI